MKSQLAATAALLGILLVLGLLQYEPSDLNPEAAPGTALERAIRQSEIPQTTVPTDQAIEFFESRVQRDPGDFISLTLLAGLHCRMARETGDAAWYESAERSLGQAIQLRDRHGPAHLQLAEVYYAQHRFDKARGALRRVAELDPENTVAEALGAQVSIEIGEYELGKRSLDDLIRRGAGESAPVLVARAHYAELEGDNRQAIQLIERALEDPGVVLGPSKDIAWYQTRLGQLYIRLGQFSSAEQHLRNALKIWPEGPFILEQMAELRAAESNYNEAVQIYKKLIGRLPRPEWLQAIGDLYASMGRTTESQSSFDLAEDGFQRAVAQGKVDCYRAIAMFYSDSRRDPDQAVQWAGKNLKLRRNVYAYDALAWALYHQGKFPEAAAAMRQALALGTRDAQLFHHASLIFDQTGDSTHASSLRELAVTLYPRYASFKSKAP